MEPTTPFEDRLREHILRSPAPGKHSARSAIRHLERATQLADSMPEVALFLAITAEEESATAVFLALQRRRYEGSNHLQIHSHVHKTALHPFLLGVGRAVREFANAREPHFVFDSKNSPDGAELLRLRFNVTDPSGELWHAMPLPPLNFSISVNGSPIDFATPLAQLASEKSAKDIHAYVKRLARRRNEVLYAASNGIPHAQDVLSFLQYRRSVVLSHFMAYLLVDQHAERQPFAQHLLAAFLSIVRRLPRDDA